MSKQGKELLLSKIRIATDEDKKTLPIYSYSRLECFKNCPMQYQKQYIEGKTTFETSLALQLGSICHKVLELKGDILKAGKEVDYNYLKDILVNGTEEEDKMYTEFLPGIEELKKTYFEEWYAADNASGMNYNEKMEVFEKVVHEEMEDEPNWKPHAFEQYFEFVWDDRAIFHGYIDRLDIKEDGSIRTVDYKTSKKIYDRSKISTSLQFGIYALAVLLKTGELPVESQYDFVLIDQKQKALTVGWEKRLDKALTKVLDTIDEYTASNLFPPKASPLCHWCGYSETNPKAKKYKTECEYYSKWTPNNKNFAKNREWDPEEANKPKRKLVF